MTIARTPYRAGDLYCWVSLCLSLAFRWAMAGDWPQYRGSNHDGTSSDRINTQWAGGVTNPVWLVAVTNGLCSFSVSGGRAFTQIRRSIDGADKEVCVALNSVDGAELWATPVDDAVYDGGVGYDDGPRSTPSFDNGSVYVLSAYLKLYRLDAASGAVVWQEDLTSIYGGSVIAWQNAASPLVENGLILLNANGTNSTLMALHTSDGSLAWATGNPEAMTHSTPVLTTIHSVHQVIFASQSGLVSLEPLSGTQLWKFIYPFQYSTCLAVSPVIYDDMVFVCGAHEYGMGSVVMQASLNDGVWTTTQLWFTNNPASHWMTPIAYQGYLYGQFGIQQFDNSPSTQLKCIDMRTGVVMWSTNNFGHGGTLLVDGHLLVLTEIGELVLAEPNPTAYTEVARFVAIPNYFGDTNKCWNSPAVADGRVYIRSTSYGACYDLSVPVLPGLKFDPPQFLGNHLQLTLRSVDGSPVDPNRLLNLEVRAAPDPGLPFSLWTKLTNDLVLTNGIVQVNNVDFRSSPQAFFLGNELK